MMLPKGAEAAEMVGDVADMGGTAADVLAGAGKTAGHVASKVIRPLGIISAGSELYGAAMTGNTTAMAGAAGDIAGGAAGGWAGAAAGAALGSVVPVIGTAVGAAVGGALGAWGGGELGSLLGETIGSKLTSWFSEDKTEIPGKSPAEQIVQQTTKTETSNRFDIKFDVKASGDPEQDNALVAKIQQAMTSLIPSLIATATPLDTRMDGSLMGLGRD